MAYDAPYRIEITRLNYENVYEIYKTGNGRVALAFDFATARNIVEALNKMVLERALARVT